MGMYELDSGVEGEYIPRPLNAHRHYYDSSSMENKSLATGQDDMTMLNFMVHQTSQGNVSSSLAGDTGSTSSISNSLSSHNGPFANDTLWELPINMRFNDAHILSITVYSILLVISSVGNITVLVTILRLRMKSRLNRVNLFLLHLAIADLLVTFLLMPLEIGWATTVSWRAGDAACRICAFFRTFGLYLSGFLLVCISLDRYFAVLKPLTLPEANRRGRCMLYAAWIGSILCSFPQALIFHVERHPDITWFEQCVTFNAFPSKAAEVAYWIFGFIFLYGFPLSMIISCYCCILWEICKINNLNRVGENLRRSNMGALNRAKIRTLKMTIVIVAAFFLCWTPYNVMSLWYFIDWESASQVDHRVQKGLFLFAVTNSCVNPIVYGLFHIRRRNTDGTTSGNGRLQRTDKEAYKFRVRWKPRTECLCAASGSSQVNSSSSAPPGRIYQRPLYELDFYRNGRGSSPNPRSHTTITRLNNRLSPDDLRNGSPRARNGPKKSRRVKFVNLQNLEYNNKGNGNLDPTACYLRSDNHRMRQTENELALERCNRSRSRSISSSESSSGGHERRAQSLPNNAYRSTRRSSSCNGGGSAVLADRFCGVHSDWNLAGARTGSILERKL